MTAIPKILPSLYSIMRNSSVVDPTVLEINIVIRLSTTRISGHLKFFFLLCVKSYIIQYCGLYRISL